MGARIVNSAYRRRGEPPIQETLDHRKDRTLGVHDLGLKSLQELARRVERPGELHGLARFWLRRGIDKGANDLIGRIREQGFEQTRGHDRHLDSAAGQRARQAVGVVGGAADAEEFNQRDPAGYGRLDGCARGAGEHRAAQRRTLNA